MIDLKTAFWSERRRNWCVYCGVGLEKETSPDSPTRFSRDHVIPRNHDGGNCTVPCCRSCNMAKGDKSLPEFMQTTYFSAARERKLPNRASLRDLWLSVALAAAYRARQLEENDPESLAAKNP